VAPVWQHAGAVVYIDARPPGTGGRIPIGAAVSLSLWGVLVHMAKKMVSRAASILVACAALTLPAGLPGFVASGFAVSHAGTASVATSDPVPCPDGGPVGNGASPAGDSADGCDGEIPS
jgi:hypothetical protein